MVCFIEFYCALNCQLMSIVGERCFVRQHVRRFFNTILREIGDWKSDTRERAVGLLKVLYIFLRPIFCIVFEIFVRSV